MSKKDFLIIVLVSILVSSVISYSTIDYLMTKENKVLQQKLQLSEKFNLELKRRLSELGVCYGKTMNSLQDLNIEILERHNTTLHQFAHVIDLTSESGIITEQEHSELLVLLVNELATNSFLINAIETARELTTEEMMEWETMLSPKSANEPMLIPPGHLHFEPEKGFPEKLEIPELNEIDLEQMLRDAKES